MFNLYHSKCIILTIVYMLVDTLNIKYNEFTIWKLLLFNKESYQFHETIIVM